MQLKYNLVLQGILLVVSASVMADSSAPPSTTSNGYSTTPPSTTGFNDGQEMSEIATYLQNLGQYFGYDLTQYCSTGGPCSTNQGGGSGNSGSGYSNLLFNADGAYALQLNLYNSYLGALFGGGNSDNADYNPIVPSNLQEYSMFNQLAGQTFLNPPYSSASQGSGVTVLATLDQQQYQPDPVSQSILNILATPNYTYCISPGDTKLNTNCSYLFREQVMSNALGTLPREDIVFTTKYNQQLVPQLNSNSLISPLLYSMTSTPNKSDTGDGDAAKKPGLTAQSQAQQAANFIRYVSNGVNPVNLVSKGTYATLISNALNLPENVPPATQAGAQITLMNYLTRLRSFAAQSSVGVGNLYYILSKRMPQNTTGNESNNNPTSEALNEYNMASWRLYNPNSQGTTGSSPNNQWLTQINQGSSASVQKEMAVLLAEINYQLYLNRQIQERILLTQSIMLIQNSQANQPDSDLSPSTTQSTSTQSTSDSN